MRERSARSTDRQAEHDEPSYVAWGRTKATVVAPGVSAWIEYPNHATMEVMFIEALEEGSGVVGRWIDALPTDKRIVFPNVDSERLRGMLERRGYRERYGYRPLAIMGLTPVRVWVKQKAKDW